MLDRVLARNPVHTYFGMDCLLYAVDVKRHVKLGTRGRLLQNRVLGGRRVLSREERRCTR